MNNNSIIKVIDTNGAGIALAVFLNKYMDIELSEAKTMIRHGEVLVNNTKIKDVLFCLAGVCKISIPKSSISRFITIT